MEEPFGKTHATGLYLTLVALYYSLKDLHCCTELINVCYKLVIQKK